MRSAWVAAARRTPLCSAVVADLDRVIHIVMTEDELLLVRRPGADWRALQAEFPGYKASLGPFDSPDAMEMIEHEWPDVFAARAADIAGFGVGSATVLRL